MSMLSPAAAAQGPGGLSTGDDSGVVLTTGDDSGSAPAAGDDSGSAPAAGDDSGSAPATGDDSGSAPAAGDDSGSAPTAGHDSGSAPAAGDGSGSAPATEDDSGSAPTTGDEGGAARPMFRAPTVRLTNSEEHYWDALDLEDGMYHPYTGSPIEPEISSAELVEGKDYTVSYKTASGTALSGAPTDVGEYYVVLTGIDTYAGKTKELRFFIFDWKNLSNTHNILLVPNSFSYTGQPVQFEQCSVRVDSPTGPVWLEKDKDFTLSFTTTDGAPLNEAPREVGTYYAVFTGKGEYTGTASTSFSIRASNDLSAAEVTCKKYYVYTGQPVQVEDLQVTLNGLVLTEGKDYTVWYDTNGYVSQTPPVGTPPAGEENKGVTISLIIRGTGAYTGEAKTSFEIVPQEDILNGATITGPAVYQQGTPVNSADFTVTSAGGTVLREGTDYNITFLKITYSGGSVTDDAEDFEELSGAPTAPGTYAVVAVLPGGESAVDKDKTIASDYFPFSIEAASSVALAEIQAPETVEYTGQPVQLGLTATLGGKALAEGTDYTLRYFVKTSAGNSFAPLSGAPSALGTYYVQLVGTGSYTGATPAGGLHEFSIQRSPALAQLSPSALDIQLEDGYSEDEAVRTVTLANTGSVAITGLAASLSGTDAASFTLDTSSLPQNLEVGGEATFTVKVNTGLGVTSSARTATLNVWAENLSAISCAVSLKVTEKPTYGFDITPAVTPVFYPAQGEQNPETKQFTLTNTGSTSVTLKSFETHYCTISGINEEQQLESGKTLTFSVAPETNLNPGTYEGYVRIEGTATGGNTAAGTLAVKVQVAAANRNVTFSTSGLNFGYWQEGQTPPERGVEIRNNGNISLSLEVELDEAVGKGFTYELRAGTGATPPVLPAPQNYQDTRSLWLYLVPKEGLPAGDYSGNVTVKDAYSGAVLGTVSVSYFAQQAQIEVTGKDGTLLATASAGNNGAAALDFGEMPYGYTPAQYPQTVTVKNTGNVAVEVGYTQGGSDWLASSDSSYSTLQPGATRTMTFTVPAGKGLGQQTREPGTASGGNIWVRMQNDVQAFARVYLGYTFTVTKPATWGEWLYDAQAQTLTRLSDNLTLQKVTAGGTSLTIGNQSSGSGALDLTGTITDAGGTAYTITALAEGAFRNWGSKLTAVTLPDGLQSIGAEAFCNCRSVTAIDIPASVKSIGERAFYTCTSLATVTLPEGLQSIGVAAFRNCSALTSIDIPASVTSIGKSTFGGCTSLKDVTLPDGLESIGSYAFRDCTSLTAIEIPSSITSIGTSAFNGCTSLEAVTLLEGLQSIGVAAFRNCSALTSIDIPASVTSIGKSTFDGCTSLAAATLPEGLQSIGEYAFQHCSALTSIKIPGTVKTVGMCSFQDCSGLASLELAEGVQKLGSSAFQNCSALTQVTLPASLTEVGIRVFDGHGPSIVFTSLATTPPAHNGGYPLGEVNGVTLYVPQGSLEAYKNAFGWKDYLIYAIQATLSPAAHTFAVQAQGYGDVAPATFTVTNSTGGSINLGAPTLSGANTADFEIDAAGLPQTLALGESATFTVRPKTGLAAGSYTAQVQLVAEDGAGTSQTLAAAVNFTVTPPVWRVGVAASPAGAGVCLVNGAEVSEASVEDGSSVTLTAKENAGYRFLRWENEQGQTLTTDKEYIVHPTADMQLQMVFEKLVYAITATPGTLEFEPRVAGYAAAPDARTVTVKNTGNTEVTLALPTAQGYDIQAGSGFANGQATLAAGGTATFTVRPKTGLAAGNYARAINVAGTNGASAVVNAAFTVEPALALTAPATLAGGGKLTLTANKGADSVVCTTDAAYNPTAAAGGTTWTVTLPQTPGTYTFEATRTTAYGGTETATCTVTVTEKAAETGGQESQNTGRKQNPKTGV